ncbi:ATP-binding protein [Anaeromicrobium sediminis]|uniref:DNA replication protein DnaC n=1 Tax=Anaeromicrobium sediminis TaxID=1478221 RepID=A0A267MFY8_9FIRM|nr:ATP-binding protein [Anaeromicrobium sediminis]PAB58489.1 DNA replication protein DnaC [Anaeromicrobium sediminis]
MAKNISKTILLEYEKSRDKAEKELEDRKKQVHALLPKLKEIEDEINKTGIHMAKAILTNAHNYDQYLSELKVTLESLKQEKAILLTENNVPLNYLEIQYNCTSCNDTGFLQNGRKCTCFKQKLINHAYKMSNLDKVLEKENFNNFKISLYDNNPFEGEELTPYENMQHVLEDCGLFVNNFNQSNENLLFYGTTGLGKTFMCNCIAKELLDRGKIVVYQTAFKILDIIEQYKFSKVKDPLIKESYQMLFDCDLLIIDDLGTELTNTFTNSEIFHILNTRLINDKKLIISTNLGPKEIATTYSERIFSRIFSKFKVMKFYGDDLRWEV